MINFDIPNLHGSYLPVQKNDQSDFGFVIYDDNKLPVQQELISSKDFQQYLNLPGHQLTSSGDISFTFVEINDKKFPVEDFYTSFSQDVPNTESCIADQGCEEINPHLFHYTYIDFDPAI